VGDGLIRLDEQGVVTFASPNALSAYRRLGLTADLTGSSLGRVTARLAGAESGGEPVDEALPTVVSGVAAREAEVEAGGTTVRLRVIPLTGGGVRTGALVLCRDVTEVRRRERELLGKDATIREIHHRVKNNLQTVAALLRLQSRRLGDDDPGARAALEEAERRIGSIAVVHETLSRTFEAGVDFDEVADRVGRMVGETSSATGDVRLRRQGDFGLLEPEVATPLALVLVELVQNAAQHGGAAGEVVVDVRRQAGRLRVAVVDRGCGLPPGFDAVRDAGLGLQIVRTLVESELGGRLALAAAEGGGTRVEVDLPVPDRAQT
jgi:two-component sensor histidine kinase